MVDMEAEGDRNKLYARHNAFPYILDGVLCLLSYDTHTFIT